MEKHIPICPLLSAGNDIDRVCAQERCSWYVSSIKTCAMNIFAKESIMNIKEKQPPKENN